MQVILLDKVVNLGNLGEIVKVKDGYARNFLIPSGRAKRATEEAKKDFEAAAPSSRRPLPPSWPKPRLWVRSWPAPRSS